MVQDQYSLFGLFNIFFPLRIILLFLLYLFFQELPKCMWASVCMIMPTPLTIWCHPWTSVHSSTPNSSIPFNSLNQIPFVHGHLWIFLENNNKFQTISLVRKRFKLFWFLTTRVQRKRFLGYKIEYFLLDFPILHWSEVGLNMP